MIGARICFSRQDEAEMSDIQSGMEDIAAGKEPVEVAAVVGRCDGSGRKRRAGAREQGREVQPAKAPAAILGLAGDGAMEGQM